ncbi:MAG: tRNA epoxyqueuosine(34) reductase QueG [Beijerinckiaceae bacterium]
MDLSGALRADAASLGFDLCRILRADDAPSMAASLGEWLERGLAGDMIWMAETADRRAHPRALWPDVRSIVMLGMNYGPSLDPLANISFPDAGNISVYARNRDYHEVIKGRLKLLASKLVARAGGDVKVFVDTAPVMEKPLAARAGLGWQGKHTNLVSRELGSWLFLGCIFTTLQLSPDEAETDHCGNCSACIDSCPTEAIVAPYRLDPRRCISYLTIEHKGSIPSEFRARIGNRIYGCDDCLAVCPWNKFARAANQTKLIARSDLLKPRLADLVALEEPEFRTFFSGSPIKRIGHVRFLRNVLIAIGNSANPDLAGPAEYRLSHHSPIVRESAIWALRRLLQPQAFERLRTACALHEQDKMVAEAWRA